MWNKNHVPLPKHFLNYYILHVGKVPRAPLESAVLFHFNLLRLVTPHNQKERRLVLSFLPSSFYTTQPQPPPKGKGKKARSHLLPFPEKPQWAAFSLLSFIPHFPVSPSSSVENRELDGQSEKQRENGCCVIAAEICKLGRGATADGPGRDVNQSLDYYSILNFEKLFCKKNFRGRDRYFFYLLSTVISVQDKIFKLVQRLFFHLLKCRKDFFFKKKECSTNTTLA